MPSMIVESPDNVVASCGNTDLTTTKTGVNKAFQQNHFVLRMNQKQFGLNWLKS